MCAVASQPASQLIPDDYCTDNDARIYYLIRVCIDKSAVQRVLYTDASWS